MQSAAAHKFKSALPWVLLLALYLALRLPNLRALPVFVDESTYARWTQLILSDHNTSSA